MLVKGNEGKLLAKRPKSKGPPIAALAAAPDDIALEVNPKPAAAVAPNATGAAAGGATELTPKDDDDELEKEAAAAAGQLTGDDTNAGAELVTDGTEPPKTANGEEISAAELELTGAGPPNNGAVTVLPDDTPPEIPSCWEENGFTKLTAAVAPNASGAAAGGAMELKPKGGDELEKEAAAAAGQLTGDDTNAGAELASDGTEPPKTANGEETTAAELELTGAGPPNKGAATAPPDDTPLEKPSCSDENGLGLWD